MGSGSERLTDLSGGDLSQSRGLPRTSVHKLQSNGALLVYIQSEATGKTDEYARSELVST